MLKPIRHRGRQTFFYPFFDIMQFTRVLAGSFPQSLGTTKQEDNVLGASPSRPITTSEALLAAGPDDCSILALARPGGIVTRSLYWRHYAQPGLVARSKL